MLIMTSPSLDHVTHLKFGSPNHISGMAEAKVVKFYI